MVSSRVAVQCYHLGRPSTAVSRSVLPVMVWMDYCTRMSSPPDEMSALRAQVAALTARVYQLEQIAGVDRNASSHAISTAPTQATAPGAAETVEFSRAPVASGPAPPPFIPTQVRGLSSAIASRSADANLEKKIGQFWLNRIGIVAILIGISYFLKYAFENNWIGPAGRVAIGLLAGTALVIWSERFRSRGYRAFSYSLTALGVGTLYLSLWAAFQLYHLIPSADAFVAMAFVTAATIALALNHDAEMLAGFAMVGGFATPVLLSTGQNHELVLFPYVCLLDLAVLALVAVRPWRRLLWGSFAGTIVLYFGWSMQYYTEDQRPVTVFFLALFAAIFAAVPLTTPYERSTRFAGPSLTLTLLPLLNAGVCFLFLYQLYKSDLSTLTWYTLALAGFYLAMSRLFRLRFPEQDTNFLKLLHVAIATGFLTIAIPIKLEAQWITIGWLVESAALLWTSVKTRTDFLRYLAVTVLALGIYHLLLYDKFRTDTLVLNARFATYLVAITVLGGIVQFGKKHATPGEQPLLRLALIALNLLALIALTLEASDYFERQLTASYWAVLGGVHLGQLRLERDFSYSAIWLIYGAVLMAIGFSRKSAFVRWQSLVLIAVTIVKVFLYDVSALEKGYRILSFVALGVVLLGISFVYQRDWLKLSFHSANDPAGKDPECGSCRTG